MNLLPMMDVAGGCRCASISAHPTLWIAALAGLALVVIVRRKA